MVSQKNSFNTKQTPCSGTFTLLQHIYKVFKRDYTQIIFSAFLDKIFFDMKTFFKSVERDAPRGKGSDICIVKFLKVFTLIFRYYAMRKNFYIFSYTLLVFCVFQEF